MTNQLKVMSQCCQECLFTANRLVVPVIADGIVQRCLDSDSYFVCHRSSREEGNEESICCKGFFDNHKRDVLAIRLALMLQSQGVEAIQTVDPASCQPPQFIQQICRERRHEPDV